jgi:hypothetical protein
VAKGQTPEQKFKRLFDLAHDEAATEHERANATRQWQAWLKKQGKKPIDISSILAQAERDDAAANPQPPPQAAPSVAPIHAFDDPEYNPAMLVEEVIERYVTMAPHVRVILVLWIVATHVYDRFSIAPRILFVSDDPESGKTTALEVARALMLFPNEETFSTGAALRNHLSRGRCSIAVDEADLYDAALRVELLRLWNLGHARGAKHVMMFGGVRTAVSLFAPMAAAGLGRILGAAQRSRTLILRMHPYSAEDAPRLDWWAPAAEGPNSIATRTTELATIYSYLTHCAANWRLDLQPPMPAGIARRAADNFRSLLAVADMCGGDWPKRAREAAVTLASEMNAEEPKTLIVRHGLQLFEQLEAQELEVAHFNRELLRLGDAGFSWLEYRGASGLDAYARPISIDEQGRLLGKAGIHSHPTWPTNLPRAQRRPGDCQRVLRRAEFEAVMNRSSGRRLIRG